MSEIGNICRSFSADLQTSGRSSKSVDGLSVEIDKALAGDRGPGADAITTTLEQNGVETASLTSPQLRMFEKFGGLVDLINQSGAVTIGEVGGLAEGKVSVTAVDGLKTDDGTPLAGFAGEGGIKLDASLENDPAALGRTASEEVFETAYQSVFGEHSKGDFGAQAVAELFGETGSMTKEEKAALMQENDSVTLSTGETGEADRKSDAKAFVSNYRDNGPASAIFESTENQIRSGLVTEGSDDNAVKFDKFFHDTSIVEYSNGAIRNEDYYAGRLAAEILLGAPIKNVLTSNEDNTGGFADFLAWGLKQVLLAMTGEEIGQAALDDFSAASKSVLRRRVANRPSDKRWLKGWLNRCDSYRVLLRERRG